MMAELMEKAGACPRLPKLASSTWSYTWYQNASSMMSFMFVMYVGMCCHFCPFLVDITAMRLFVRLVLLCVHLFLFFFFFLLLLLLLPLLRLRLLLLLLLLSLKRERVRPKAR